MSTSTQDDLPRQSTFTRHASSNSTITLPPLPFSVANEPKANGESKSRFGAESTMSLLVESLKERLLFAVPKKGRLHEKCLELLAGK